MTKAYEEKLKRRNRELALLNGVAQALNRSLDPTEMVRAALAQVAQLLALQTGWVWLRPEASGLFNLAATQNLPPALADYPEKMEGGCFCLNTYQSGDLNGAANVNVVACSRLKGLVDGTDGLRYHASIPLYGNGRQLGVLNVASQDWQELSADDLQLLYTVGDMLGIALERAYLFEKQAYLGAIEERNRLAREIHDTLAQGLTAVSLQLESADALLEAEASLADIRRVVQQALALTQANLEEARRSVMDLRALPLQNQTLVQALTGLTEQVEAAVQFDVEGGVRPLARRLEMCLYRVAQEALTNVSHHAQATQVSMRLIFSQEQVCLSVADDGVGFDPQTPHTNSFGLIGINERVKLLNGRFRLESTVGCGTHLWVAIPLPAADEP